MSFVLRVLLMGGLGLAAFTQTACNMVPRYQLQQAQYRTRQLYEQNRALAQERNGLLAQIQSLQQQIAGLNARDETLQARVNNLLAERNHLTGNHNPRIVSSPTLPGGIPALSSIRRRASASSRTTSCLNRAATTCGLMPSRSCRNSPGSLTTAKPRS